MPSFYYGCPTRRVPCTSPLFASASAAIGSTSGISSAPGAASTGIIVAVRVRAHLPAAPISPVAGVGFGGSCLSRINSVRDTLHAIIRVIVRTACFTRAGDQTGNPQDQEQD